MRTILRIIGWLIIITFVGSVLFVTIKESIEDISYLIFLLLTIAICGVFLLGIYLTRLPIKKKKGKYTTILTTIRNPCYVEIFTDIDKDMGNNNSLEWWNMLSTDEQMWLMMKHGFEKFNPKNVTSDQINKIYSLESN